MQVALMGGLWQERNWKIKGDLAAVVIWLNKFHRFWQCAALQSSFAEVKMETKHQTGSVIMSVQQETGNLFFSSPVLDSHRVNIMKGHMSTALSRDCPAQSCVFFRITLCMQLYEFVFYFQWTRFAFFWYQRDVLKVRRLGDGFYIITLEIVWQ